MKRYKKNNIIKKVIKSMFLLCLCTNKTHIASTRADLLHTDSWKYRQTDELCYIVAAEPNCAQPIVHM